jgi:endonuclease YncB( thermonuclease family)
MVVTTTETAPPTPVIEEGEPSAEELELSGSEELVWPSAVIQLHDGDTFKLLLDAGCDTGLFPWLRVAGVDSPELKHPRGQSRGGVHRRNAGKRRRHQG